MHHGSSKDARPPPTASENLPLSASPGPTVELTLEVARAGAGIVHRLRVPSGTRVRDALSQLGILAEGCAVLDGAVPVPLDLPVVTDRSLTVVPTFSGG
jgi:sulfur carrier protein ThiS